MPAGLAFDEVQAGTDKHQSGAFDMHYRVEGFPHEHISSHRPEYTVDKMSPQTHSVVSDIGKLKYAFR
ncbi:MAG: hypothetical protein M1821_006408 [Bathelium mastoideum]|nr:MAG: hypothetical protein M1821_006408 [Bathelium mastoideum]